MSVRVRLPNNWRPRPYQKALWSYLERGGLRASCVWHRRSGKDDCALHWTAVAAMTRPANYWHMLPQQKQARKAIWDAVSPHTGKKRIDEAFPHALREGAANEQEMRIRFKNGSTWQVVGSDAFNNLVGATPAGIVFSEWALSKPAAWSFLRPILAENGGWSLFITTPRGRNHAHALHQMAEADPAWFAQRLSARDSGVFSPDVLDRELREYVAERGEEDGTALFEQEYLCSFEAAIAGSYYGRWMARADAEGRIRAAPVLDGLPVHSAWDLGVSDSTSIWCFQVAPAGLRVVDYYEASGQAAGHYAEWLDGRGYRGTDYVPHDAAAREWGSGRTRMETLKALGRKPRLVPAVSVADGIQAARTTLERCTFDADRCADGIEALRQYRREWDEGRRCYHDAPHHDWTSHAADAFRYMALAWREAKPEREAKPAPLPPGVLRVSDLAPARRAGDRRI